MGKKMNNKQIFKLGELFCGPGGLALGATTASIADSNYKIVQSIGAHIPDLSAQIIH